MFAHDRSNDSRIAPDAAIGQSAAMDNDRRADRRKKKWSELSPQAKAAIVVGGTVEAVLTTIALRDLARRAPALVRGPKLLWLLAAFVQPFGPLLYLGAGRRRSISARR